MMNFKGTLSEALAKSSTVRFRGRFKMELFLYRTVKNSFHSYSTNP